MSLQLPLSRQFVATLSQLYMLEVEACWVLPVHMDWLVMMLHLLVPDLVQEDTAKVDTALSRQ